MDLSAEDSLRLNVLLANAVAVRIDEGAMLVYGLSEAGEEAKIQLNPTSRPDQYIRRVRELLSSAVLGSPGGYPVYLKRWTRMGQASGARLGDLLMLGEPEAVVAVSGAPGLTDELARRAWWAMPDSDNARRMLQREEVVKGEMGRVLADFLVEFLPFEEEPQAIIESVRLILQPGLIDEEARNAIWERGRAKSVFRIGFLQATPDTLPEQESARDDLSRHADTLEQLRAAGNPVAAQLSRLLSGPGQTFLKTCELAMRRPSNQDAVCALLEAIGQYFSEVRISPLHYDSAEVLDAHAQERFKADPQRDASLVEALDETHARLPDLADDLEAMLFLAHVGEPMVRPIFSRTDAVGSVMRRKLEPVSKPVVRHLLTLGGNA